MNVETSIEPRISRFELGRDQTPRLVLRPKVLVAEGDGDLRNLLSWALRRDGCDVIESGTSEDLLDYLSSAVMLKDSFPPPDLILTDVDTPELGLEILGKMRRILRRTPLVLLASDLHGVVEAAALQLHAVHVFAKPVDLRAVRALVRATIAV
jgi:DNA-binding response OmpR family regulator